MDDFSILVVDDEPDLRDALEFLLRREGYSVTQASSAAQALAEIQRSPFDLVISDILMPEMHGIELLKRIKQSDDGIPVLMITGQSTIQDAVEAIKLGAEDYIAKPFDNAVLLSAVRRLYKSKIFKRQAELLKQEMLRKTIPEIIGQSKKIQRVLAEIESIAPSDGAVLITGESGTGKELVARGIHALSKRKKEPFIAINAAAVPKDLLESEFFGHEKGAFSGASDRKYGLFEIADQGTLFLDEIAEMPLDLQAKMLRTVETKKLRRLGGIHEITIDIRIISATNRNLKEEIKEKRFREDLYFRLSTLNIHIPPLRERKEDIPLLAHHYLSKRGYPNTAIPGETIAGLQLYDWPGNVRELENALERAALLSGNQPARLKYFPPEIQELYRKRFKQPVSEPQPKLSEIEKDYILKVYESTGQDKNAAAQILGIGLKTLYRKLKSYGQS